MRAVATMSVDILGHWSRRHHCDSRHHVCRGRQCRVTRPTDRLYHDCWLRQRHREASCIHTRWRFHLRAAANTHQLCGDRTLAAAGPRLCNSLPVQLRNPDITYALFRRQLKGHLSREAWIRRSVTSDTRRHRRTLTYLLSVRTPRQLELFQGPSHRQRNCAENYNKWHNRIFFLNCNQHFDNISNHNSFPVLFDKVDSVYFRRCY